MNTLIIYIVLGVMFYISHGKSWITKDQFLQDSMAKRIGAIYFFVGLIPLAISIIFPNIGGTVTSLAGKYEFLLVAVLATSLVYIMQVAVRRSN